MAEASSHNTSSPKITPKEEPVSLDKPKSPNPFLHATQVEFTFKEISFTTNNEVALLYPSHPNQEYFKDVSDFISKCCLKEAFTRAPTQYKEYLSEFGGKTSSLDQISNKDTTILYCLANGVQVDYAKLIWEDLIHKLNKKTREKIVPYPRFISLLLEHMMPEYDNEELTINSTQAQQAAGGPTSLGAIRSNPSVLLDKIKSVGDGLKTAHTDSGINEESSADDISKKIKLKDLSEFLKDTRSAFFTLNSPQDEPIIFIKDELEQQKATAEAEVASLKARSLYPDVNQLTTLLVTSLKPELSKLLASHNFASFLPTDLKELPLKFTELSREIKELKKHVKDMEIELPGDLKDIPTKLETFTSTISSLTSQVAELKNIQWELLAELQALPVLVSSAQKQLKTLDSLPCLLNKVTKTLNRFATVVENASGAMTKDVSSAGQATASPAKGEKNTKDAETNLKEELVDLLGTNGVTQYYNKKLLFDKYCDKMLKRKKSPKITNYEVLTKKGPITLKIYREDGSEKVISNLKTRLDQLTQTEQDIKIDLNKPLKEQDPLNELNELANKKRKRTSDLKDHSRSTKKHKSSSSA
ncbi:hypothetical protein Tco_0038432 [Tanacetum coccineum]